MQAANRLAKQKIDIFLLSNDDANAWYLIMDGVDVGIVISDRIIDHGVYLRCVKIDWSALLNKLILKGLAAKAPIKIEIAPVGDHKKTKALGTALKADLEKLFNIDFTNSSAVLIETAKRKDSNDLPNTNKSIDSDITLVAFYLPQFHPIIENNIWWGKGFTEWTKVCASKPQFKGHKQPRLPDELGFYDLRVPEVMQQQALLAKEYGIGAFCFYHYWFGGRRLLEQPLDNFLNRPEIDIKFCICWANEPWSRRWDGLEEDVLIDQPHTPETDATFMLDILHILKDARYLKVNNKPIILIYRVGLLAMPSQTVEMWRQICRDNGIGEIELVAVEAFDYEFPNKHGFDATVEFPPHGFNLEGINVKSIKNKKSFKGKAWEYGDAVAHYMSQPPRPWKQYRGVMPRWDNTPRRGRNGYAFIKSNPKRYASWLNFAIEDTRKRLDENDRLIFINAWNEWGEGAMLEPDIEFKRGYLEATKDALLGRLNWKEQLNFLVDSNDTEARKNTANSIVAQINAYHRTLEFMTQNQKNAFISKGIDYKPIVVDSIWPQGLQEKDKIILQAQGLIDKLCLPNKPNLSAPVSRYKTIEVEGWMVVDGHMPIIGEPIYIMLIEQKTKTPFFAAITKRFPRVDLRANLKLSAPEEANFAGFRGLIDCSGLFAGDYALSLIQKVAGGWGVTSLPNIIELV